MGSSGRGMPDGNGTTSTYAADGHVGAIEIGEMRESRTPSTLEIPEASSDVEAIVQETREESSSCRKGKSCGGNCFEKLIDFLNIFDSESQVRESVCCRPACGFLLTVVYLVGVVVIGILYWINDGGRPPEVRIDDASPGKILKGSMEDYFCMCDLPAEVHSYRKDDDPRTSSSTQNINRCYSTDEMTEIDVLQFGDDTVVKEIIDKMDVTRKTPQVKTLNSSYTLRWKSYELTGKNASDPIHSLTTQLETKGYVGKDGVISLTGLAESAFFTVPQGFIRADLAYACNSCQTVPGNKTCPDLWEKYGVDQAAPPLGSSESLSNDAGWIFCYQTSGDPVTDDTGCAGACRFFRTLYRPWGIAMAEFASELQDYGVKAFDEVNDPDVQVVFRSRLLYANVSEFRTAPGGTSDDRRDQMNFMDIKRSDNLWTEILSYYNKIPSCADEEDKVQYCTGISICQAAPVYSHGDINSETIEVVCMNNPAGEDAPRTECAAIKESLGLEFRDKNETRLEHLCDQFACNKVQSSSLITWNSEELVGGEIALSRLIYTPSVITAYRPALCTNQYTQVFLRYDESKPTVLLSVHQMNCRNTTNVKGCWMTGFYKNVTDTRWDPWKLYPFTDDEVAAGEKMFTCYRFVKQRKRYYAYARFGLVSGAIGSWLLCLSCIFWVVIKTNMPKRVEARLGIPTDQQISEGGDDTQRLHDGDDSTIEQIPASATGPDDKQGHNDEDDSWNEQNPAKITTSYQRLRK